MFDKISHIVSFKISRAEKKRNVFQIRKIHRLNNFNDRFVQRKEVLNYTYLTIHFMVT